MSRYIDADKLIEAIEDSIGYINFSSPYQDDNDAIVEGMERIKSIVDEAPTVDAVPKGLFDQIKWERDIAIGQLQEIGCELGQKMEDVKSVLMRRWEWLGTYRHNGEGWVGTCPVCKKRMRLFEKNYCPNCGADMREREENA